MTSSRRDFIEQSATLFGSAWLTINLPVLDALSVRARQAFELQEPLVSLTPEEARTLGAFAEQILPTTDTPGAREAGALYFIDRALKELRPEALPLIKEGLKDLDVRAAKENRSVKSFADLTAVKQIGIMKKIEKRPFFGLARALTVMGTFSHPKYGGNRDHVGFKVLQIDHQPVYKPPFGYYDAQHAAGES